MPKLGMEKIRKQQLIDATIESIHIHGLQGTTITTISQLAGVSSGIISHYFGGKGELFQSTVIYLLSLLRSEFIAKWQASDGSDYARIDAIIDTNLSDTHGAEKIASAWLCFWAQCRHSEQLFGLQKINSQRLASNLTYAIKQVTSRQKAQVISEIMAAQIDGVWLRCALGGADHKTFRQAAENCKSLVRTLISQAQ